MELHDKQVKLRFTVEQTITTTMQASFTTSMPEFAVRDIYDLKGTLARFVENAPVEKADWKAVGHPKVHLVTVSFEEVK